MSAEPDGAPAFFRNALRRPDLAWNDWPAVAAFLRDQAVCRLGVFDETHPYVVAQSYRFTGDAFLLHFSRFGRLARLVAANRNVTVEVSQAVSLLKAPAAENTSMEYRSVIARCTASLTKLDERIETQQYAALDKYRPERDYLPIDRERATRRIVACRATVVEMSAKKRILADGATTASGIVPDYARYPFPPPPALSSLPPEAFDNRALHRFAAYGTLRSGESHRHLLEGIPDGEPASVIGMIEQHNGYPCLLLDANHGDVSVELFESERLVNLWPALDRYEGTHYERRAVAVRLPSGDRTIAQAYVHRTLI